MFFLRSTAYTISTRFISFHGRCLSKFAPVVTKMTEMKVREGSAEVKLPDSVFYNPVQEFNRDITIAVIRNFLKLHLCEFIDKGMKIAASKNASPEPTTYVGISILEALAASGLRSVRFANEIPLVCKITANDVDPEATKLISENAQRNHVSALVQPTCSDAVSLMLNSTSYADRFPNPFSCVFKRVNHIVFIFDVSFNVVDIDPYGTASPFLDSAVQCLYDGGLLCVTSTDMAVLCGATPGTAYGKYGGVAIKMTAQHEQGLRLLLYAIQQAASRHGKVIEPLLSLSIDFYARVFVRVRSSPRGVKHVAAKMALVYSCTGCHVSAHNKIKEQFQCALIYSNIFKHKVMNLDVRPLLSLLKSGREIPKLRQRLA
ncbi:unnamed protein product [Schistocephalus solidus]|uniref:tRNA (guanine(26)-N(2))-dimethyltransferase n=1 Tax=Schistocephalus solidus TaxID=70667 RepID=A0A3P7DPK4_SCHSO|nr:unnamed protein product [Schistocephalus solidus]